MHAAIHRKTTDQHDTPDDAQDPDWTQYEGGMGCKDHATTNLVEMWGTFSVAQKEVVACLLQSMADEFFNHP